MVPQAVASVVQLSVGLLLRVPDPGRTGWTRDSLPADAEHVLHCATGCQANKCQVASGPVETTPEVVRGCVHDKA